MQWKPVLIGAVGGAIALAIIGFSWGGWVTGSSAERMVEDQVSKTLVGLCVANASTDEEAVAAYKAATYSERQTLFTEAGWGTLLGTELPTSVARSCASELMRS